MIAVAALAALGSCLIFSADGSKLENHLTGVGKAARVPNSNYLSQDFRVPYFIGLKDIGVPNAGVEKKPDLTMEKAGDFRDWHGLASSPAGLSAPKSSYGMAERGFFHDEAITARVTAMHPLGRVGEPDEVAKPWCGCVPLLPRSSPATLCR